ncbi:MAG: hypothetical protein KBS79_00825 [Lachnospiraceae bacterium]|nr:hypothetical protein [Candidatus Minthocola equi]
MKKHFAKLIALITCLTIILAGSMPAMAAESWSGTVQAGKEFMFTISFCSCTEDVDVADMYELQIEPPDGVTVEAYKTVSSHGVLISGKLTKAKDYHFLIRDKHLGLYYDCNLTVTPSSDLSIKTDSLPNGKVGSEYSAEVSATSGCQITLYDGAIPLGLSYEPGNPLKITGTPTTAGTSSLIFIAKSDDGQSVSKSFTITIAENPTQPTTAAPTTAAPTTAAPTTSVPTAPTPVEQTSTAPVATTPAETSPSPSETQPEQTSPADVTTTATAKDPSHAIFTPIDVEDDGASIDIWVIIAIVAVALIVGGLIAALVAKKNAKKKRRRRK